MNNFLYRIKKKLYFPVQLLIRIFIIIIKKDYSKYPRYVFELEKELCNKFNSKFSLTFSSGTAACFASILSLGHKKNSLALVSKLSFPSTIISLIDSNYKIKYYDFDSNFNPIFSVLENDVCPDLIVYTHVFGFPVGFQSLEIIKKKYKHAKIIFDCSHSQGAKFNNKNLNEYADLSFFSIQGSKAISGGEGGFVLTNNEIYYNRMIRMFHPGRLSSEIENKYTGVAMSIKLRMHPLAAVIASDSLKKLEKFNHNIIQKINSIYKVLLNEELIKIPNTQNLSLGGFHYGLPFYSEKDFRKNTFVPIKRYNWPFYEKNNYYNSEIFHSSNFEEKEMTYSEIAQFREDISDIRSKLFFIDLDWIKFNSENYLINNIKYFLRSIK